MDFLGTLSKIVASILATVTGIASSVIPGITPPQITPTPTPSIVMVQNLVTRSGEIAYMGQSIKYTVNFPKNGGEITGVVSGICEANIKGVYDGIESGNINGSTNPSCGVAFLRKSFSISYSGLLFLKQGRADLNWEGNIPSTSGSGSYTFNFEPEK